MSYSFYKSPLRILAIATLAFVLLTACAVLGLLTRACTRPEIEAPEIVLEPVAPVAEAEPAAAETVAAETVAAETVAAEPVAVPLVVEPSPRELPAPDGERLEEYEADRSKSILELQLYRRVSSIVTGPDSTATLVSLNPAVHAWFVLGLRTGSGEPAYYHLENADPKGTDVLLDESFPEGIVLRAGGEETRCPLGSEVLEAARAGGRPFSGLCGDRLYLRNPVEGRRSSLETATDFLRDNVWAGEKITVFIRQNLYQDRFLETSEVIEAEPGTPDLRRAQGAPPRPQVNPRYDGDLLVPDELGLELENDQPGKVLVGRWYPVRGQAGVYVSTIQPRLVASEVIESQKRLVNSLDEVESSALVYLVAFSLDEMDLGFALGTDHPRMWWSERVPEKVRDESLPGPDGLNSPLPLVRTGKLSPVAAKHAVGTFTGGFKRSHGAFKSTALATSNHGTHYGFVESGVVFSKLQPGLATVIVWNDGSVELKTWTEDDDARLGELRHARQNGLPIVETDPETGEIRPGKMVPRWRDGNWSGSQDQRLRTLRAGLCLRESPEGRFLIYAYFSGATPSGMARVFQAYGCGYALMLDMNALEHTYLALYHHQGEHLLTQHLIEGMKVLDESGDGRELPRFLALADNRDFFYLTRKDGT